MHNSSNGVITLVENIKFNNNFEKINENEKEELEKMGFFINNSVAYQNVIDGYNIFKADTLSTIIELTQKCNLKCVYCYQEDWNRTDSISEE